MAAAAHEVPYPDAPASVPARCAVPDSLLLDAVSALAGARTEGDVAGASLPLLLGRSGARAAAVVQRRGAGVVVLGSAGYPCGTMAAGADLPLDAGLPVTEAVRTGATVVHGSGPSWVAVPFGRGRQAPGALLLSLDVAPPAPEDVVRLQRLATALGDALRRSGEATRDTASLAAVSAGLRSAPLTATGVEVATRSLPADGGVGGDVVGCLPDGGGGTWLVAADVCGSGIGPALVAHSLRAALRVSARTAGRPAELLADLDDALGPDVGPASFVTATAVHLAPGGRCARVATAGHPAPLLVRDGLARAVEVEAGPPLALEGRVLPGLAEVSVTVSPGTVLLLHTDGLTERRRDGQVQLLDAASLATGLGDDLESAADAVLAAADWVGPKQDDVSLLLARPVTGA